MGPTSTSRFTLARSLRALAISAAVGAFVGLVMSLSSERMDAPPALITGAMIGVTIDLVIEGLQRLFGGHLCRMRPGRAQALRVLIYMVGGALGWSVGFILSLIIVWRAPVLVVLREIFFIPMMLISGGIAIAVGLVIFSYDQLRIRLEQSVAQLKEHEFAEKELELARAIQARLLPPPDSEGDGYRIAARNLAARYVAGDFYDIFHLVDGWVGLVVADVSGKGMGASLIMASVKAVLPFLAAGRSVEQTLMQLNARLTAELGKREFVALAIARFEPSTGRLQLANAGLPDPYHLRRGSVPRAIIAPGPHLPLGIRAEVAYQAAEVHLEPGDRFLMISDGIPEAPTAPGELLGYETLTTLLSVDGYGWPAGEWLDGFLATVRARTAATLEDDWTALVLERTSG